MLLGSSGRSGNVNAPVTRSTLPIPPSSRNCRSRAVRGWCGHMKPSISSTLRAAQKATNSRASAAVGVSGFSHRTCLPRSAARRVHSACSVLGSGM